MVIMIITIISTTNNTITTTTITNIIIIMSKMNFSWLSSWSSTRWDITDRERPTNLVNLSHPHSAHNAIGREQQESHWQTAEKYQMIWLYLEREAFFEQRLKIKDNKNSNDQNSNHAFQGPAGQSKAYFGIQSTLMKSNGWFGAFFCHFGFEVLLDYWTFQEPHFDNLRFLLDIIWTRAICICLFVMSWYFCWQKPTLGHLGRPRCRPAQPSQSCPSCQKTKAAARSQEISKNPLKNCPKSPTRVTARGDFLAQSCFLLFAFSCQLQFH